MNAHIKCLSLAKTRMQGLLSKYFSYFQQLTQCRYSVLCKRTACVNYPTRESSPHPTGPRARQALHSHGRTERHDKPRPETQASLSEGGILPWSSPLGIHRAPGPPGTGTPAGSPGWRPCRRAAARGSVGRNPERGGEMESN